MDTTPGPRPTDLPDLPTGPRFATRHCLRSSLGRGLGAAGAAVAVAFVGTTGLGAAQAHAAGVAGVAGGLTYAADASQRPHGPRHAAHPTTLPPATTTAVRYTFDSGGLIEL